MSAGAGEDAGREFLVEVGCEEIPADWLDPLVERFAEALETGLREADLAPRGGAGFGTPRRLVARFTGVPTSQPERTEEVLGPPARVGRDADGGWTRAAAGFARRHGIGESALDAELRVVSTPRGEYVGFRRVTAGLPAAEVVPPVLEAALRSLPFPKTMHWDAEISGRPFPFGRPIRWLVLLLGGEVVPFTIEVRGGPPVVSGAESRGHRFRSADASPPGAPFAVDSFESLRAGLARRCVLLDPEERRRELARKVAECAAGAAVAPPSGDLPNLVEWPGAVFGTYPEEFESLPEEIRRTVLVHHQKYLPVEGACAFVAVTNLGDDPTGAVRRGVERVVLARMRDARFFWDDDRRAALGERREALRDIVFHRELGSLYAKSERMESLAGWIADRLGADRSAAARAAALAKCDLSTGLVGEFASLQGVAGGLYLREEGEREAVWRAVYDHYRPEGAEGRLPETVEGAAVALADRADTLAGFFLAGEAPSGAGDPYGLRRAALSLLRLLRDGPDGYGAPASGASASDGVWPSPLELVGEAFRGYSPDEEAAEAVSARLREFLDDRLPHALRRASVPAGAVRAVLARASAEHPVADTWARALALAGAVGTGDCAALAAAAKRVRRILTPEARGTAAAETDPARAAEPAERALLEALAATGSEVSQAFARGAYPEAFGALARLGPAVDRFFDEVLVLAEDPAVRANRLALLVRLDALFSEAGDLGEIESDAGR